MSSSAPESTYVFDGLLRAIHAWNGLSVLALIITGWIAESFEHSAQAAGFWRLHIQFGYVLTGGLGARLVWGLIGPRSARWTDLWHPRDWLSALRALPSLYRPAWRPGHDKLASGVFIALYLTLLGMIATGIALAAIKHNMGPLADWLGDSTGLKKIFKNPHELMYLLVTGFIGLHLAALIWHQTFGKTPVAQAMITGNQYPPRASDQAGTDALLLQRWKAK